MEINILKIANKFRILIGHIILMLSRIELFFKRMLPTSNLYATDLKKSGFIKWNDITGLSKVILQLYSVRFEKPEFLCRNLFVNEGVARPETFTLDLNNEFLWRYVFTEDLYQVLNALFGGKFYLRNNALLMINKENDEGYDHVHIDGASHLCNVMINLENIGQQETYMEYYLESNNWNFFGLILNRDKITNHLLEKHKGAKLADTRGATDSCFIFDAGNGLHRRRLGKGRKVLLLSFTNNKSQIFFSDDRGPNIDKDAFFYSCGTRELQMLINKSSFKNSTFDLVCKNMPFKNNSIF